MDINFGDKFKMLINGEEVKCTKCNEGHYKPLSGDYKKCYDFRCDKCGSMISATPKLKL